MSTRLSLVQAQIALELAAPWPELTHRIGAKWLANQEDPLPRAVWVPPRPGQVRYEPPDFVGQSPQCFRMAVWPVEIHLSAASLDGDDGLEQLAHDVAAVLHRQLSGNYELMGGGFLSEDEGELAASDQVYVLQVELRFPIVDQLRSQTTETAEAEQIEVETQAKNHDGSTEDDVEFFLPLPPSPPRPPHRGLPRGSPMDNTVPAPAEASASPSQGPPSPTEASATSSPPEASATLPGSPQAEPKPSPTQSPDAWAKAKGTSAVHFACARALQGWCAGVELAEADFDAAIAAARRQEIR